MPSTRERTTLRALVVGGAMLTLAAWLMFWWLALPRHDICQMTLPAPAGCNRDRVPVAVFWTVVTGALYGVTALLRVWRPGRRWWFTGLFSLFVAAVWGYWDVLFA
ncbi:hypothetical protein AB0G04_33745 [Actinoplanes sp. NPDC023801]|uniref:hypothetical protein n=1 Tax=Actinoplanes sp. NPDC023801 TaxID=3154595 RepID=UPI0033E486D5